jgi:LemA protein
VSSSRIAVWIALAVLLFWIVGAYNRLVGLRGAIVRQFVPVERSFAERHRLLLRQLDALAPVLVNAAPRLDALRAACGQSETACAHAKLRPGTAGAIASLRLAEDILGEARARLPVQSIAGTELSALNAQLAAADTALAFARRQFNEAVSAYNHAVRQFPTSLIVGLFQFRAAAAL